MTQITATAHTNIALIKYWGKLSGSFNIPATDSLSLTLDQFFTTTSVGFADSPKDTFVLNNISQDSDSLRRVSEHIDLFRTIFNRKERVHVQSINHVMTSSGLASSASGFAALTLALAKLFGSSLDPQELSRMARRGSGSAARSVFEGFALLHGGPDADDKKAYAEAISSPLQKSICMLVLECSTKKKSVSSREAMRLTANSSIFYKPYLENHPKLLCLAMNALEKGDLDLLGECMEQSTMQMHGTMLGCSKPFWYFNSATMHALQCTSDLRAQGYSCYFTMDAGPHVKILCKQSEAAKILKALQEVTQAKITQCAPGPGAYLHE